MDVSTVAGGGAVGSDDGQGTASTLNTPAGLAHDRQGNTFISELGSHRIRKMAPGGAVTTYAGSTQGHQDGPGDQAKFDRPCGMACDAQGNLYVADSGNNRIRKITPASQATPSREKSLLKFTPYTSKYDVRGPRSIIGCEMCFCYRIPAHWVPGLPTKTRVESSTKKL